MTQIWPIAIVGLLAGILAFERPLWLAIARVVRRAVVAIGNSIPIAVAMAKQGAKVTIIERAAVGSGASSVNSAAAISLA